MSAIVLACLLPFLTAAALPIVCAPRSKRAGRVALGAVLICLLSVLSVAPPALHHPLYLNLPWAPSLGLSFGLYADGLSILFGLVICGIGAVVFAFAGAYLGEEENRRRFFVYLLLFMGAMLGVVFSANLISLFVFWEMTSVSSYLLIGFWHPRDASRDGALKALVITSCGGLAMLVGFILLGQAAGGSYEIQDLIARRHSLAASPLATWAAVLVLLGAITKSAQLPFHLWLPSAMEAPTPVSAFLHAATMVKAGLYLVARLGPALALTAYWTPVLMWLGVLTMAWASLLALRQRDLKGLLAFSTVSQLGLIMTMLAPAQADASAAGLFHLLNHSLFKGSLFLLVGIIEHEAHTRDVTALGPLRQQMPRTWLVLLVSALAMAGVPPLGGFISKEMFLAQALERGQLFTAIAVAGAMLTAGYCFSLIIGLAKGRVAIEEAPKAHDPGLNLLAGPALLALGALALGLAPQTLAGPLVEAATSSATAIAHPHVHLALWHGVNAALLASLTAVLVGLGVSRLWLAREPVPPVLLADRAYSAFLKGLEEGSRNLTNLYMSGLLWRYLVIILGWNFGVAALVSSAQFTAPQLSGGSDVTAFSLLIAVIAITAAMATVRASTRLAAILALGATGYTLALIFALRGAPDLALTQIMVETISVALFLTVFVYLPPFGPPELVRKKRPGHAILAALIGFGSVAILAIARQNRSAESIADYYLANSVTKAGGHNVVNVILVDFRGLDTMGEISVLGIAALACFALIKLRPNRDSANRGELKRA